MAYLNPIKIVILIGCFPSYQLHAIAFLVLHSNHMCLDFSENIGKPMMRGYETYGEYEIVSFFTYFQPVVV